MDFLPKDPAILEIRKAERHDVPLLLEFIDCLAGCSGARNVRRAQGRGSFRCRGRARGRLRALLLQLLNIHRTFRIVS